MILTLTPNPSLDRTVTLAGELLRGGVNRLGSVTTEPGGKGLNVARVLVAAGEPVTALLPTSSQDPYLRAVLALREVAGAAASVPPDRPGSGGVGTGQAAAGALPAGGLPAGTSTGDDAVPRPALTVVPVPVAGSVRVNTAVTEPDGTTTKLNEPGAALTAAEVASLEQTLIAAARAAGGVEAGAAPAPATTPVSTPVTVAADGGQSPTAVPSPTAATTQGAAPAGESQAAASSPQVPTWVVLSGSLPPGAPTDWYAHLTARLHRQVPGARVVVDTSDAPLAALMDAAAADPVCAPELIKPNGEELGQLAGLPPQRAMALEEGARRGELAPVVAAARTLVARGIGAVLATLGPAGAVLVTGDGAWHATAPDVPVVSTVGAGDSSVAGYLLAAVRGGDEQARLVCAMAHGSAAASLPGTRLPTPADLPCEPAVVHRLE